MKTEFLNAKEAIKIIENNSVIATSGFVGLNIPYELLESLEKQYLETNLPQKLTLIYAAGQGDGKNLSLNLISHEGLLKKVIGGHYNLAPKLQKLVIKDKIEAYNLPQGVISQMFRELSAGKKGIVSKVGLKTFVEIEGGKLNKITKKDIVHKIKILDEEYLYYEAPKIDYCLLKGSYSDENGNITLEEEGCFTETTSLAFATKNSGGKVIVQVKDIVKNGSLDPRLVKIPATVVDIVVKSSDVEKYHKQTYEDLYNPSYCTNKRAVLTAVEPRKLDNRKIIGRRCFSMIEPYSTINLGIGIPEVIAEIMNEEGLSDKVTLTVESGIQGGVPAGGLRFGEALNPEIILDQDKQFDFYDGGGLDIAFLGLAQCDEKGNINVSRFGTRIAGCGGFINISQNTKEVVFCGTFTTGGLKEEVKDGKLYIIQEGKNKKFIKNVEQITFSADYALETKQKIKYITERAVFSLNKEGLILEEIAPGIDLEKDIINQMEFKPVVSKKLKLMDISIFEEAKMVLEK